MKKSAPHINFLYSLLYIIHINICGYLFILLVIFEMGSCYVDQADFKFSIFLPQVFRVLGLHFISACLFIFSFYDINSLTSYLISNEGTSNLGDECVSIFFNDFI